MIWRLVGAAAVVGVAAWFVLSGQLPAGQPHDVRHDPRNCGHVGVQCPGDEDCVSGMCLPAAAP